MNISEQKLNKFINTIKNNASMQVYSIEKETQDIMDNMLTQAEDEAIKESYELAKKEQDFNHSKIVKEYAEKENELKQEFYKKRSEMVNDVFKKAEKKLMEFHDSSDYEIALLSGLNVVKEKFGNSKCIVYVKKDDINLSSKIINVFEGNAEVTPCDDIKIGGVRILFCDKNILVDKTLDALLLDEREKLWITKTMFSV